MATGETCVKLSQLENTSPDVRYLSSIDQNTPELWHLAVGLSYLLANTIWAAAESVGIVLYGIRNWKWYE